MRGDDRERIAMPQFLLSVWHDDDYEVDFESEDNQRLFAQVGAFNADLEASGALVYGNGLEPPSTAKVARPSNGEVEVTSGPYASSKQVMGGFWIVEAASNDDAVEIATRAALACEGPVEVRPFQQAP